MEVTVLTAAVAAADMRTNLGQAMVEMEAPMAAVAAPLLPEKAGTGVPMAAAGAPSTGHREVVERMEVLAEQQRQTEILALTHEHFLLNLPDLAKVASAVSAAAGAADMVEEEEMDMNIALVAAAGAATEEMEDAR